MKFYFLILTTTIHCVFCLQPDQSNFQDFYPTPLETYQDCFKYAKQSEFKLAKCDAYFYNGKLYLDNTQKYELRECLMKFEKIEDFVPTLLFSIQGFRSLTDGQRYIIFSLIAEVQTFATIIPQILTLVGPRGSDKELFKDGNRIGEVAALAVSETESTTDYYSNHFFAAMRNLRHLDQVKVKLLVLNSFHLYNVRRKPHVTSETMNSISAVVLYVTPQNAHKLGKQTVMHHLRHFGYKGAIYIDMPGSPLIGGSEKASVMAPLIAFVIFIVWFLI